MLSSNKYIYVYKNKVKCTKKDLKMSSISIKLAGIIG